MSVGARTLSGFAPDFKAKQVILAAVVLAAMLASWSSTARAKELGPLQAQSLRIGESRQKNRDISVGVGRGLRQQAQLLRPDVQHDRAVERKARPGAARRGRNAPRKRRDVLVSR